MSPDFTEDLKQMSCFIQQTNIPQFVYKLHTLFGDYHQDLIKNMEKLAAGKALDYVAIMSDSHITLHEAAFSYCRYDALYEILLSKEYQTAYLFCLHMDNRPDSPHTGSVLLSDTKKLKDDARKNSIIPMRVSAIRESGRRANIPMDRWYRMELSEKQKLQSWGYQYSPTGMDTLKAHYAARLKDWQQAACPMQETFMLDRFNEAYMAAADHPQDGMYRIPHSIAKQLTICADAPVFRLLPEGPEKLAPITAISTGLWFESYREFAVRRQDLNKLESFISQDTRRLMGLGPERPSQKALPEKHRCNQNPIKKSEVIL